MTQHWCLWPQKYQDTTRPVRFVVDGLKKKLLVFSICFWYTQQPGSCCSHPTASLQSTEGRRNRGHQRGNIPSPSPSCPCLHVCMSLGAGREKAIPISWRYETEKQLIATCKDFVHMILKWGQAIEHVKCWERRTPRPSAWVLQDKASLSYWNSCA